jgi:hypothetical protein
LWGALLGGLVVMVLPSAQIAALTQDTAAASLGLPVQLVVAAAAALLLGGMLFLIAAAISASAQARAQASTSEATAERRVRPIDPARDLGSRSLDDPLDTMPFASPAWRDTAVDEAEPAPPPPPEPAHTPEPAVPQPPLPPPRALDLGEFGALPGRNAVWVEEPVAAHQPAPVPPVPPAQPFPYAPVSALRPAAVPFDPSAAALARLRAVPPSQLSLVEMVERFAGALHHHRASPPAEVLGGVDLVAREAALAEALKALAALSGDEAAAEPPRERTNEPLRAALARLQGGPAAERGAA